MKKIISAIMIIALLLGLSVMLISCKTQPSTIYLGEERLDTSAELCNIDGIRTTNLETVKTVGDGAIYDLMSIKSFNTIELSEKGANILKFEISISQDGNSYNLVYSNDTVEAFRSCYLGNLSARYIKLTILEAKGDITLKKFFVYNIKKKANNNFRVTTYLVLDNVGDNFDASGMQAVTDVIIFGGAWFNEYGEISRSNNYANQINKVKEAIQGMDINLWFDISLPGGKVENMLSKFKYQTIASIINFAKEFDFYGYDIDYEYPYTKSEWEIFNSFLVELDKNLGERKLSVATSTWNLNFSKEAIDAIDNAMLMTYDLPDSNGYHSAFSQSIKDVEGAIKYGFPKEKLEIGLPFYSRPLNMHPYWGGYNGAAEAMGKFGNLEYGTISDHEGNPLSSPRYFNGYQMIQDKVAAAIDMGIGGVMIWHYSCDVNFDNPLSLFKAIYTTKAEKLI